MYVLFSIYFDTFSKQNSIVSLDECDRLAVQISRVMEEAGEKVEGNLEEIRMTYSKKIQKLEDVVKKVCNIIMRWYI